MFICVCERELQKKNIEYPFDNKTTFWARFERFIMLPLSTANDVIPDFNSPSRVRRKEQEIN